MARPALHEGDQIMAEVTKRVWKIGCARKFAWGDSLMVPCRPCPHRTRAGEVAHPDGVRQERVTSATWTEEDARKARAARLLGVTPPQEPLPGMAFGVMVEKVPGREAQRGQTVAER